MILKSSVSIYWLCFFVKKHATFKNCLFAVYGCLVGKLNVHAVERMQRS